VTSFLGHFAEKPSLHARTWVASGWPTRTKPLIQELSRGGSNRNAEYGHFCG
jgi:hypothetical protein